MPGREWHGRDRESSDPSPGVLPAAASPPLRRLPAGERQWDDDEPFFDEAEKHEQQDRPLPATALPEKRDERQHTDAEGFARVDGDRVDETGLQGHEKT
jgi:hypothetical protein